MKFILGILLGALLAVAISGRDLVLPELTLAADAGEPQYLELHEALCPRGQIAVCSRE